MANFRTILPLELMSTFWPIKWVENRPYEKYPAKPTSFSMGSDAEGRPLYLPAHIRVWGSRWCLGDMAHPNRGYPEGHKASMQTTHIKETRQKKGKQVIRRTLVQETPEICLADTAWSLYCCHVGYMLQFSDCYIGYAVLGAVIQGDYKQTKHMRMHISGQ